MLFFYGYFILKDSWKMLLKSKLSINKTLINTRLMNFKLTLVSKVKVESSQRL